MTRDISQALDEHTLLQAAKRTKVFPCHTNRGSEIAWPCPSGPRYLYLLRKHWKDLPLPPGETELLFEEGHLHEDAIARRLEDDGWKIWKPRKAVDWKAYQITGSLDREGTPPQAICEEFGIAPDTIFPLEMKALEPHSWGKINSAADMLNAKQPWLRKYPGQLLMYLLLTESPEGFFILKNKVTGRLKYLPMVLEDWLSLGTRLLDLAQEVNTYIAAGNSPPVKDYEEAVCGRCHARSICMPGEVGPGAIPLIDDEIEAALQRRDELKPLADEFKAIDDEVKEKAKLASPEDGKLVCGDWEIAVKTVTKIQKAQLERTLEYREARIRRLRGETTNDSGTD